MRSETAKKILSETPEETKHLVREYESLKREVREFKLLVREYFQLRSKKKYSTEYHFTKRIVDVKKRILSELETFSDQEQNELPFKD